jgi:plastocyanin
VPGVAVSWAIASGDGAISPAQSTTSVSGVATTADSVGSASSQAVTATFTGLATPVSFSVSASAPPATAAVTVQNNSFNPDAVVMKTGGTVTWTWNSGGVIHDVEYDGGPTPFPTGSAAQGSGSHSNTITTVGRYTYHCNFHAGMSGSVRVVH